MMDAAETTETAQKDISAMIPDHVRNAPARGKTAGMTDVEIPAEHAEAELTATGRDSAKLL